MFLKFKNLYLIHVLLKNSKFFLRGIVKIFYTFLKNFIKKYEIYTWVDLKVKTKNINWKFFGN
jgi:hypothetical protein